MCLGPWLLAAEAATRSNHSRACRRVVQSGKPADAEATSHSSVPCPLPIHSPWLLLWFCGCCSCSLLLCCLAAELLSCLVNCCQLWNVSCLFPACVALLPEHLGLCHIPSSSIACTGRRMGCLLQSGRTCGHTLMRALDASEHNSSTCEVRDSVGPNRLCLSV